MRGRRPWIARAALAAALAAVAATGCDPRGGGGHGGAAPERAPQTSPEKSPEEIAEGVLSSMDRSADPCVDFHRYACGGWIDGTVLPGDETRWARSFSVIDRRNREALRAIVEDADLDPRFAQVGDFYRSCMDVEAVEAAGVEPLRPYLDAIAGLQAADGLPELLGRLHGAGLAATFRGFVFGDFAEPDTNVLHLTQGGLGLPDRGDYLSDAPRFVELRRAYVEHVAAMLALTGVEEAAASSAARDVLALETELARASRERARLRDAEERNNRLDLDGLSALAPGLDWRAYLAALGRADVEAINVWVPEFFERLDVLARETPVESWRAYLRFHAASSMAPVLTAAFVREDFEFYSATLRGQKEMQPRDRRCVQATDRALGELLGRAFVERRFAGDSKEKARALVDDVQDAFAASLPSLGWMDPGTAERALEKKDAMVDKIGYPDVWKDYGAVEIRPDDYAGNTRRAERFELERDLAKIGEPVDPDEWGMTPPTVNAYYSPSRNEIVFPAGILQEPFFHRDYPAAMNYGGIGMVIGHELTHGFDDNGRKYDPEGRLADWWSEEAVAKFEERAACVEDLYRGFEIQPDLFVDGKLTLGENIADLGGIRGALAAYRERREGPAGPSGIGDLTDEQLFFVAFAQTWCMRITPEEERRRARTDTHSPGRFRVVGPLVSFPAFAETFACAPGTPMNPAERCEVW